ncbi:MAG TPA: tripartite tricarboxylate transporter TctB family protein [Xanthobacteraceae bacterium]|nr:tripartite tricarboxylate transporter TctB family protein [Xanthobacteraceae bacterium]
MSSADRIAGSFFLLLGIGVVIGAVHLQLGTPSEPQPGFFPFLGGAALVLLSAILIIRDLRARTNEAESWGQMRAPLLALAGLVAFVALLRPLGYVPATAILTVVLLLVFEVRKVWVFALAVPIVSAGTYLLFDRLLGIPLPPGPVDAWLGL